MQLVSMQEVLSTELLFFSAVSHQKVLRMRVKMYKRAEKSQETLLYKRAQRNKDPWQALGLIWTCILAALGDYFIYTISQ